LGLNRSSTCFAATAATVFHGVRSKTVVNILILAGTFYAFVIQRFESKEE
jgi:hypothetical protein